MSSRSTSRSTRPAHVSDVMMHEPRTVGPGDADRRGPRDVRQPEQEADAGDRRGALPRHARAGRRAGHGRRPDRAARARRHAARRARTIRSRGRSSSCETQGMTRIPVVDASDRLLGLVCFNTSHNAFCVYPVSIAQSRRAGRVVDRPARDPRLRADVRGRRDRRACSIAAAALAERREPGTRRRGRAVGLPGRPDRRAALPRDHELGRGPAHLVGRRSRSGRAASGSGAGSRSACSSGSGASSARAPTCRAFMDAGAPALLVAQVDRPRSGNWFNQELFGKPTTCRGASRSTRSTARTRYRRRRDVPPRVPLRDRLEPVAAGARCVWLGHHRRIRPPGLFALYVAGYSAFRDLRAS